MNGQSYIRQISHAGGLYQILAYDVKLMLKGRGQSYVARFFNFAPIISL